MKLMPRHCNGTHVKREREREREREGGGERREKKRIP